MGTPVAVKIAEDRALAGRAEGARPPGLPFALQDRHHDEVASAAVGQTIGLAQHTVAGEAQLLIGPLSAGVVGEAVEIEALGAQRPESLVENEAQKRRAQALPGAGDGDALEV